MATVLLIEDQPLNRDVVVQILEDRHRVIEAIDGEQGLRMAEEHRPDIILLDLSLPKIDGWQVARGLRENAATRRIPIVALTAHAMKGDEEKALAAGCDRYLSKPVDDELLIQVVDRLLAASAPAAAGDGARIIVVDDEANNREILCEELSDHGYRSVPCSDAASALAEAGRAPPDLFLLDVMMPGIDGIELCRRIREADATRDVPVIFVSAKSAVDDKRLGLDSGGNDYITKPYQLPELLARVQAMLRFKRRMEEVRSRAGPTAKAADDPYRRLEYEFLRARRYNRRMACILLRLQAPREPPVWQETIKQRIRDVDLLFVLSAQEALLVLPEAGAREAKLVVQRLQQLLAAAGEADGVKIGWSSYEQSQTLHWGKLLRAADEMIVGTELGGS